MERPDTPDRRLAETAAAQHGVVCHRQARTAGLSDRQIRSRRGSGGARLLHPTVWALPGAPRSWRQEVMAALLAAGCVTNRPAAAAAATALHLLDPTRFPRPARIEIAVARGRPVEVAGVTVHEAGDLLEDVLLADGVPCTTGERALLDGVGPLDPVERTRLVDDVLCSDVAVRARVYQRALELRRGRPGVAAVAQLTAPGAEAVFRSGLERAGNAILDAHGLPPREVNVVLHDDRGRVREVDVLFRAARLVVEWDGLRFHSSAAQRARDRAGDRRLTIARYRVLRFSWEDVERRPHMVADQVTRALAS